MRRVVGLMALGLGVLAVATVAVPWLLYRDVQWRRRARWIGGYEQPAEPWVREAERQASYAEAGARAA